MKEIDNRKDWSDQNIKTEVEIQEASFNFRFLIVHTLGKCAFEKDGSQDAGEGECRGAFEEGSVESSLDCHDYNCQVFYL